MKVKSPSEVPNEVFAGAVDIYNLGEQKFYGHAIEVTDGPNDSEGGLLVYIPGVALDEMETDDDDESTD